MKKSDGNGVAKNKFESLPYEELLRHCLELEDENAKLRPKPAKFRLGQVVAYGLKNNWVAGQPAFHFTVLSTENRYGDWYYGYGKNGPHGFHVYPENKLRALNATEIDGTVVPATVATDIAATSLPAVAVADLAAALGGAGAQPVALDIEIDPVEFE